MPGPPQNPAVTHSYLFYCVYHNISQDVCISLSCCKLLEDRVNFLFIFSTYVELKSRHTVYNIEQSNKCNLHIHLNLCILLPEKLFKILKKSKKMNSTLFKCRTEAAATQGPSRDEFGSAYCLLFIKRPRFCLLTCGFSPVE